MDIILLPLFRIVLTLLSIYSNIILIAIILSWLRAFNVINPSNRFFYTVCDALERLTEPVFAYARRFIPPIGGLDLSPVAVLLAIQFLQSFLVRLALRLFS